MRKIKAEGGTADGWMNRMIRFANGMVGMKGQRSDVRVQKAKIGKIRSLESGRWPDFGRTMIHRFLRFPQIRRWNIKI